VLTHPAHATTIVINASIRFMKYLHPLPYDINARALEWFA
jgi:hypothetical protein